MVLVVALNLAGRGIEGHHRRGEEIVTGTLIAHPRPAIARAPEGKIGFWIVGAGDPYGPTAGLPLIAFGPGLGTQLTGLRHGVSLPSRLSGLGIERRDKPANAELTARNADDHLAVGNERGER